MGPGFIGPRVHLVGGRRYCTCVQVRASLGSEGCVRPQGFLPRVPVLVCGRMKVPALISGSYGSPGPRPFQPPGCWAGVGWRGIPECKAAVPVCGILVAWRVSSSTDWVYVDGGGLLPAREYNEVDIYTVPAGELREIYTYTVPAGEYHEIFMGEAAELVPSSFLLEEANLGPDGTRVVDGCTARLENHPRA